jgi:GT2 family glycosyltransferase
MNRIKFSVVIPLYNKEKSIAKTLASVKQQRFPASEIIVIDDGSTDNSIKQVLAANIPTLKLIKQTNKGVSAARNLGVEKSSNEFIAFIDADDQWSPFFLDEMRKLINKFPEQAFFDSNYQKVQGKSLYQNPKLALPDMDATGVLLSNYFEVSGQGDLPFMASSTVITKKLFKQLGGFPVGEAMGEDQALFSQACLHSPIAYSPLILLFYHTDSENRACERHIPSEILPFAQRLIAWSASCNDEALKRSVLTYCAAHACNLAKINIQMGNLETARQLLNQDICALKPVHQVVFKLWSYLRPLSQ